MTEMVTCPRCLETYEKSGPGWVTFHICHGKPKDFLIGEVVEEQKEIEQ